MKTKSINKLKDKFYERLSKKDTWTGVEVINIFSDSYSEIISKKIEKLKSKQQIKKAI